MQQTGIQRGESPRVIAARLAISHLMCLGVFIVPVTAELLWAALIGGWVVCLFIAIGAMVEDGSAAALVGRRAVARAHRMRQDYRWAGSYFWALLRAGGIWL